MRQSITLLVENSKLSKFLFQSIILNAHERPPLYIFGLEYGQKNNVGKAEFGTYPYVQLLPRG